MLLTDSTLVSLIITLSHWFTIFNDIYFTELRPLVLIAGRETPWYSHTTYHSGLARTANPLDGVFVGRRVFTQTTSIETSHTKGLTRNRQSKRVKHYVCQLKWIAEQTSVQKTLLRNIKIEEHEDEIISFGILN